MRNCGLSPIFEYATVQPIENYGISLSYVVPPQGATQKQIQEAREASTHELAIPVLLDRNNNPLLPWTRVTFIEDDSDSVLTVQGTHPSGSANWDKLWVNYDNDAAHSGESNLTVTCLKAGTGTIKLKDRQAGHQIVRARKNDANRNIAHHASFCAVSERRQSDFS